MIEHETPLITTIVAGLGVAFILGGIANRLKISPIVGYLLAGVLIGPATPGIVVDTELAPELAEIGVILLMFGVGLHFSIGDLLSVRAIAIPGAVAQIVIATLMGMALAWGLGWPTGGGIVFGLALSVASTVVLLRALQERRLVDSEQGRIAVGWLVVEDLAMVLALVLLPALAGLGGGEGSDAGTSSLFIALAITLAKVVAFVALMLVVGRRFIPWVLHWVAHTGSRELFRLAVLAIALGMAFGAAKLFDVSFALGAFFAGMILSESPLSQRAAEESLPFRDAFAVLFFVSVGMLFDPAVLIEQPLPVIATVAIILFGKSIAAFAIVRAFGYNNRVALTISASLAQVGEFSFILAALGLQLGLLPEAGQDLILAGAIISILVNPIFFELIGRVQPKTTTATPQTPQPKSQEVEGLVPTALTGHAILIGYGRVGSLVGESLLKRNIQFLVIEDNPKVVESLKARKVETIIGNAADPDVLSAANLPGAKYLFLAIPEPFEAAEITKQARAANATSLVVARAHFDAEVEHLMKLGASAVIMGEREIALGMVDYVFEKNAGEASRPAPSPSGRDAPAA